MSIIKTVMYTANKQWMIIVRHNPYSIPEVLRSCHRANSSWNLHWRATEFASTDATAGVQQLYANGN